MKKRNKLLALLLTAALTVSVTACGSSDAGNDAANTPSETTTQDETDNEDDAQKEDTDSKADADSKTDADPLATAQKNMADVSSLSGKMIMEMDMDVSADGATQSLQTITTMDMTYFNDPMHLKADITVDAGETGTSSSSIYAETAEDGTCTMYMTDGTNWQSQTAAPEILAPYNVSNTMTQYMESGYEFEAAGTEEVDGANAYKYTASLSGDSVKEALSAAGALDSFTSLGISAEQLEGMMSEAGDMEINLWIDEANLYPVKYEMDMTSVMNALVSAIAESMAEQAEDVSMTIPKMTFSLTCSDYNAAEEFSIPEEAKASTPAAE